MSEIHINPNDIETYIRTYGEINKNFVLSNYVGSNTKKTCSFFINGIPCKIDIYIKKETVNIVCIGQNKDTAAVLVDYLSSKGYSATAETKQFTFNLCSEDLEKLLCMIKEDYANLISCENINDNVYKLLGYNKDKLMLLFYPDVNKATIQGRPYFVYNIVVSYLSDIVGISFEDIVNSSNAMWGVNVPYDMIREVMKNKLGKSYNYLDEALRKTISGSICQQYSIGILEDYSVLLIGVFRGLEGYLTKVLTQKFNYKLTRFEKFRMFKKDNNGKYDIENNPTINRRVCDDLISLYKLFQDKRNVYSHSAVVPSMTAIIEDKKDAIDISDEILKAINNTYQHFFGV